MRKGFSSERRTYFGWLSPWKYWAGRPRLKSTHPWWSASILPKLDCCLGLRQQSLEQRCCEERLDSSDTVMKTRNLNSLCSCRVARGMASGCVGLFIVVFSGGALVLSLHAQNGPTSGQSGNQGHVAVQASE